MGRRDTEEASPRAASQSSSMSMSCMRMNAGIEKPPLTRRRVTQLSYPMTSTDPELSADSFLTSYVAMSITVTALYIPTAIVLHFANNSTPPATSWHPSPDPPRTSGAGTYISSLPHRTRGAASGPWRWSMAGGEGRDGDTGHDPEAARAAVLRRAEEVKAAEQYDQIVSSTDKALLDSAEEHFRRRNHQAAIHAYDAYLDRHPEDTVAWNNRGVVFDAMGDNASAVDSYFRAVELQPSYEVAWCNRGNSLTYMGRRDEAVRNYLQSIRVNRGYRPGYDYLVQTLLFDAPAREVLRRLQELEAEIGESAYFKYHQGLLLDDLGRHRRAVRMYARALELDASDPEVWKAKGNAHFNLDELDLAIEAYDEALNLDLDNEEVWNNRGFTFFTAGFMSVAIECYRQAVRINPAYRHAWYNLGYTFHQMDRLEDAIEAYAKAIEIDDEDEILLNNRGNAEYNLGNYLESIPWFERAVRINPRYDIAWNNIGNALNRSGRDEEAIPYHLKTLEINPKFDYAMYAMGESYHGMGRPEKALEWLDKSLELNPNYDHTWLLKAEVLHELGRPDEALESVENAIRLNEDFDEAHFLRGGLLEELGRPREAASAYDDALAAVTRAISTRPAQGRMWERKGMMLAQLGEYSEAVRCYDTALLMPRTSMSAREARADVLLRSHRYTDAIESMRVLEGGDRPDPTDLRLRVAEALAEEGRRDEVHEEVAHVLAGVLPRGGAPDVEVDLDEGEEDAGRPGGAGWDGSGPATSPDAPRGRKEGDAPSEGPIEVDGRSSAEIVMPYRPSTPEPREPTDEDRARAHHAMGRAALVAGDADTAIGDLRAAAAIKDDLPRLQLDIGNALREAGDVAGALEAYRQAADHDLDDEAPRALAGLCHLQLGDARAAEAAFDSATGIAPDYSLAWFGKGRALMARGRHRRALRYLRQALRLDPHLTVARISLAEALVALGRATEARAELGRARALDPGAEDARTMLEAMGGSPPPLPEGAGEDGADRGRDLTTEPAVTGGAAAPPGDAGDGEGLPPVEEGEVVRAPGPEVDRWLEEHRDLPPLRKDDDRGDD